MQKILVLAVALLCCNTLKAWDKDNHALITAHAIKLLNDKKPGYICPHEAALIIKGNVSEDAFNHKWFIRPFNQHFYNPQKACWQWKRSKSIDVRFQRLVDRLYARVDKEKYFYSVGEIVHHIQDVSNPSHVVPVHHGGPKIDVFDKQCIVCLLPQQLTKNEVSLERSFPLSMLTELANKTLNNIKAGFAVKVTTHGHTKTEMITWEHFWKENKCGWFGNYGKPGKECAHIKNRDQYLQTHIHKGCSHFDIRAEKYDDFTRRQVSLAVNYTALVIFYAKEYAREHHQHFHHHCH